MGHSYNNGLHTSSKGITFDAVRITGLQAAGTPVVAEDCKSGLVSSVTQAVAGTVVLQLSRPYPPKLVVCIPRMTNSNGTTDIVHAEYKEGGYNASTGQLTIFLENDDDAGAPVLVNAPTSTAELHVLMAFNRYNR